MILNNRVTYCNSLQHNQTSDSLYAFGRNEGDPQAPAAWGS